MSENVAYVEREDEFDIPLVLEESGGGAGGEAGPNDAGGASAVVAEGGVSAAGADGADDGDATAAAAAAAAAEKGDPKCKCGCKGDAALHFGLGAKAISLFSPDAHGRPEMLDVLTVERAAV